MSIKHTKQVGQARKLRLNKETLRDLDAPKSQALQVVGGASRYVNTVPKPCYSA